MLGKRGHNNAVSENCQHLRILGFENEFSTTLRVGHFDCRLTTSDWEVPKGANWKLQLEIGNVYNL
jgi:hypothetical protein